MPRRTDIRSILVIGSGPIVIGQACEFDYSGTQACKVLKSEGYRVLLVNSNPATIMTDPVIADATYIEPITAEYVEEIIAKERPDAILPTMGGQTALNVAVELHERGILEKYGVELIGSKIESIKMAEDRELFLEAIHRCGLDMPKGEFITDYDEGMKAVERIGFPAIIRPSFTLGGTGGGIAYNMEDYAEMLKAGLVASPINRVLVEESVLGWKEYELEVMRDVNDNVVIVCSIENFDPMGVHTGDSITVAPAQTLSDREYQRMRDASLKIIRAIGVETGGSNIQFALNPVNGRMTVIEMNPRVSRSSALASKATGFPIAKMAAKLAIGYTLDEIINDITKKTPACFEPSIDYVVVKIPRWDFEKFREVEDSLTVQMKSVGEVMSFGRTFKEALQKAVRSVEKGRGGFGFDSAEDCNMDEPTYAELDRLRYYLRKRTSGSLFDVFDALRYNMSTDEIYALTKYDTWFIEQLREIVEAGRNFIRTASNLGGELFADSLDAATVRRMKQLGFSDRQLSVMTGIPENNIREYRKKNGIVPVYKTVDTCAAEFESETPYHYSTYGSENESVRTGTKKVIILGSGPNRIGQGIEFDYCCVQAVYAARARGWEAIMINCNPETVSTDYDTTNKLYFEPLTFEDVMNVIDLERPDGVVVSFGGQTPLKLAQRLVEAGVTLMGTQLEGIDVAEDRKHFGAMIDGLGIPCPPYGTTMDEEEAVEIADRIGYPVLVRPSYVLGGRAMELCYREEALRKYVHNAFRQFPGRPILIDHFLENAYEFDVDCVADGDDVVIGDVLKFPGPIRHGRNNPGSSVGGSRHDPAPIGVLFVDSDRIGLKPLCREVALVIGTSERGYHGVSAALDRERTRQDALCGEATLDAGSHRLPHCAELFLHNSLAVDGGVVGHGQRCDAEATGVDVFQELNCASEIVGDVLGVLGRNQFGLMLALDKSPTDRVVDALEQVGAVIGQCLKLHAIRVPRQHCERVKGNVTEREGNGVVEQGEFL